MVCMHYFIQPKIEMGLYSDGSLIVQVSVFASGCPSHAQTLGSSAGSPAA